MARASKGLNGVPKTLHVTFTDGKTIKAPFFDVEAGFEYLAGLGDRLKSHKITEYTGE